MTIHFRTRIESPVDYSRVLFPGTLGCCCTGPDPNTAFESSYGNCNALNGYFTIETDCSNVQCFPQGTTGCCCACSYDGATEGIEFSVCQDLDGVWEEGPCTESPICVNSNGRDVQDKRACCGYTYDDSGNIVSRCFDVCTEQDCYALRLGGFAPTFFPTGGDCFVVNPSCATPQTAQMNNDTTIVGNCCIQGYPCRCFKNLSFDQCELLSGSFYILGDPESSCEDCIKNCSETN